MPDANVFISNSMMGAASDENGFFVIRNIPPGTFELVASVIGYEAQKKEIHITGPFEKEIVFKLKTKAILAPEIIVTPEHTEKRKNDLKRFANLLLSTSKNVSKTKIVNPEVLEFRHDELGRFTAVAHQPLVIENDALGYRLHFVLNELTATEKDLRYSGFTRFEPLTPKSDKQLEDWQENRLRAYRGSLRHFLATICDTTGSLVERLKKEGFEIFKFQHPWERESKRTSDPVNIEHYLKPAEVPHECYLDFPGYLGVTYTKEYEERNFLQYHKLNRNISSQESWIKLSGSAAKINIDGRYSGTPIMKFGYWAWERFADMLPYEYQPE